MALTIYHSNHLESLQAMASHVIRNFPLDDPMQPEYFMIHSSGMTNWLKGALAKEHGIFANTKLEFPINLIVSIIENLLTEEERARTNLRISRLTLTWAVYDVLMNSSLDELILLKDYLNIDHNVLHEDVRAMSLAEEIAGLLDKYLAYRPEWFEKWEKGKLNLDNTPFEEWQKTIWQKISHKILPQYHLGNISQMIKNIPKEGYQQKIVPKRLFVIGISTLPPLFIDLLHTLSKNIDVHLFFTNPSQYYWGDLTQYRNRYIKRINFKDNSERDILLAPNIQLENECREDDDYWLEFQGNPFLANFGKIGRDFIHLLSQYDDLSEIEAFSEPTTQGLLGEIQRHIFNLSPVTLGTPKYSVNAQDRSIAIHSHYSERREVEGLYDQLLHLFNSNTDLKPKDIIVMAPDIDRYRPMIEAVFSSPFSTEAQIPFTISDFTLGKHEFILDAFLILLSITESHFSVSEILTLLDIPEIREKFNLSQEDMSSVERWIDHTHIRYGIDEKHLTELNVREDFTNTWLWGLKRLLLGYGFSEPEMMDGVRVFPYVSGGSAIALGHLIDFIDALIALKDQLSQNYTIEEWRSVLSSVWSTFYVENEETQSRLLHIESIWNTFIDEGVAIGFDREVSIHLLYRHLEDHLSSFRPESRFLTGSVNFCTFIPMRSIPFKIVCMLGMNQDSFPHVSQYPEYDLMQIDIKRGDRSSVNDERYLFLEAILSAEQYLYISYIGRNIQNNSEMFPSLFVNELLFYIEEIAESEISESMTKFLTIEHPLSSYSPQLFEEGSIIQSFQAEWLPTFYEFQQDHFEFNIQKSRVETITPRDIINGFKDPLKSFSIHHFGTAYYDRQFNEIENDELFSMENLGYLERYKTRVKLMEELFYNDYTVDELQEFVNETLFHRYKAEGVLPKFAFARLDWNNFTVPILSLVQTALSKGCEYGKEQQVAITVDDIRIKGTTLGTDKDEQCLVYAGNMNLKRQFESFITHLVNTVNLGKPIHTTFIYYYKEVISEIFLPKIDVEEARNLLKEWIKGYIENLHRPYLLAPENCLRKTSDIKFIKIAEHFKFICEMYHHFDEQSIKDYMSEFAEFKECVRRVENGLDRQFDMLERRLFNEITLKEVIAHLYFVLRYVEPMKAYFSKANKIENIM